MPEAKIPSKQPTPSGSGAGGKVIHNMGPMILQFLHMPHAVRCAVASKAFYNAAQASIRSMSWARFPVQDGWRGEAGTATEDVVEGAKPLLVGAPCLDLRAAGDAIDDDALYNLLRRAFRVNPKALQVTLHEFAKDLPSDIISEMKQDVERGNTSLDREARGAFWRAEPWQDAQAPVLRGLAVSSKRLTQKLAQRMIGYFGYRLEVLSFAGCPRLEILKILDAIERWGAKLVTLDLSTARLGSPVGAENLPKVLFRYDSGFRSMLGNIGANLVALRLFDCHDISDENVCAIAETCTQLRELEIGVASGPDPWDAYRAITGSFTTALASAPCSSSLQYLGLRMRVPLVLENIIAIGDLLSGLLRLDLAGIDRVHDGVLVALASKVSLTHIDLSRCSKVTSMGVSSLAAGSPNLSWVSLHSTGVSDSGIRALCESCVGLQHLNLSMTSVTGRSLRALSEVGSLRWINLRCCLGLRGSNALQGVADLRRRLTVGRRLRDKGVVLAMEHPRRQRRTLSPGRLGSHHGAGKSGRHAHEQESDHGGRGSGPDARYGSRLASSAVCGSPRSNSAIAIGTQGPASPLETLRSKKSPVDAEKPRGEGKPEGDGGNTHRTEEPLGEKSDATAVLCSDAMPSGAARKVPLLPPGVGDLQVGCRRGKVGTPDRRGGGTGGIESRRKSELAVSSQDGRHSRDGRERPWRDEDGDGGGGGDEAQDKSGAGFQSQVKLGVFPQGSGTQRLHP